MNYYNKKYFEWQRKAGEYGAQQDLWMYEPFIKKEYIVLDFGCGGGYMLAKIKCKERYGVEINPLARKTASKKGLKVYESLDKIPAGVKFDVIMTHHTLEHVNSPLAVLESLKRYLKPAGRLVCVVPIDDWRIEKKYFKGDINQHIYTWTPLLIGNLFIKCGYKISSLEIIERAWVPLSRFYFKYVPSLIYNFFSMIWSKLTLSRQIRIVAYLSIIFFTFI